MSLLCKWTAHSLKDKARRSIILYSKAFIFNSVHSFYFKILSTVFVEIYDKIKVQARKCQNKVKYCRYLPVRVEIFHYASDIILVFLPFFPLILSHQCLSGNCGHTYALCKHVCTSACQHDVGCLRIFSWQQTWEKKVNINVLTFTLICKTNQLIAHRRSPLETFI